MKRSPLVALVLSVSFVLQLVLARDGTTCIMAGAEHEGTPVALTAASSTADMSAMDMMAGMDMSDSAPGDSCDHGAMATACLVMAPCAGGFIAVAAAAVADANALPERIVVATADMPPSPPTQPELPPPRA